MFLSLYICLSRPAGWWNLESVRTGRGHLFLSEVHLHFVLGEGDPYCIFAVGLKEKPSRTGLNRNYTSSPYKKIKKNSLSRYYQSRAFGFEMFFTNGNWWTSRICSSVRLWVSLLQPSVAVTQLWHSSNHQIHHIVALRCTRQFMKLAIHKSVAWHVSFSSL